MGSDRSASRARQFRKKPVTIEALQWTGDNLRDVIAFTGRHPSADAWTWEHFEEVVRTKGLKIFSLEGSKFIVTVGDYIIKGVRGEFYACKPDIFAMTYEDASALSERTPATYSWGIQRDKDGQTVVVKNGAGAEVMWIGAEELIGDFGPREVLTMLRDRLTEKLDDPSLYTLAGDIFAMTEKPSGQPKKQRAERGGR